MGRTDAEQEVMALEQANAIGRVSGRRRPKSGAGSRYVEVPAASIVEVMDTICAKVCGAGGKTSKGVSGREVFVDIFPPHTPVGVRVYTSLAVGDDSVRGCGEDAVRLIHGYMGTPRGGKERFLPLNASGPKKRRIYRTAPNGIPESERVKTFLDRLTEALRAAYQEARECITCPDCEGAMVIRANRTYGTQFWGCTRYPECKGTRRYDG